MIALVVDVAEDESELAADALWGLGVVAVEEREGTDGRVELWTSLGDDVDVVREAIGSFPSSWRTRFVEVDDAVVDTWREHATPTWIDAGMVVRPVWVEADLPDGVLVLDIEPGATFGMGDHPTTVLSLRSLRAIAAAGGMSTVLDVGCGSGVLAIAALRLGATSAVAVDISPAAAGTTLDNAERNGVADRLVASTTPLQLVEGHYDVVLANILAPALIELSADLRRVLAPDGTLVISGILADRHAHVLAALAPLRVVDTLELDGWVAVTLRR
ncbi:MAG: 50S ribosomal protein L11 methyltransferase [Acidimicrobiales bacterium]